MESLVADENEHQDLLMNNFGVDSGSESETDEEESCLRLHRDFMAIPQSKKNRPPPTKLLLDQKVNATALIWNKLVQNSTDLKNKTPFELFTSIWTKDVVIYIVDETNIFAKQMIKKYQNEGSYETSKLAQWKPTNPDEIFTYLGILVAMSQCVKPKFKDYFDPTIKITLTPNFKNYIKEDRFWLLYNLVHIVDNTWFNQALTNPRSDVLQLIHFMHHYCLKNNEYIKVWYKRKFIKLLNYCIEKIRDLYKSSDKYRYDIGKDIYDKLFEKYKTVDFSKVDNNLDRGVVFCADKDFTEKVVSHMPRNILNKKEKCVVCQKISLYFCPSCNVYLCLKMCYRKFSHGQDICDLESSSSLSISPRRIRKKRRRCYEDDDEYDPPVYFKNKITKGKTKVVASKK